jgi:hypothetical protein
MELGAAWPSLSLESDARRVLAQLDGETPRAFAERVASELDGLFGKGVALGQAILACNERCDEAADGARRKLGGLCLGSMAKHPRGKVVLSASPRCSGRLRQSLASLARGLFDEWRTAGLETSVDFGEAAAQRADVAEAPFLFTARVA